MIIYRYLCREIYYHMLAVTSVLLIIFITNEFGIYLNSAAAGNLSMLAVMKIMSFQVPLLVGYLLPLGFYLAILLVLGRMYMDNEITVLLACGMSRLKLLNVILFFALILTIFVSWLMLWVEPIIDLNQVKVEQSAVASAGVDKIIPKHFQSFGKSGIIYAEHVDHSNKSIQRVFFALQQKDAAGKVSWDITDAQNSYRYKNGQDHSYFVFDAGQRYVGVPGELKYQAMKFQHYGLRIMQVFPRPSNADYVPTWQLIKERNTDLQAASTLHWRIALPLTVVILALTAFPLARVNPRQGKFGRFIPAIAIYTIYADFIFMGRSWIHNGTISPQMGMWWLHGIFLILALFLNFYFFGFKKMWGILRMRWGQYANH